MEDNKRVVETKEKSLEKDPKESQQCNTEKFITNKIKKNKDGQTEVVPCLDPDILCSEIKKEIKIEFEESIKESSKEIKKEIKSEYKDSIKEFSRECRGSENNHLPSKPVIIRFMKKNVENTENYKNGSKKVTKKVYEEQMGQK